MAVGRRSAKTGGIPGVWRKRLDSMFTEHSGSSPARRSSICPAGHIASRLPVFRPALQDLYATLMDSLSLPIDLGLLAVGTSRLNPLSTARCLAARLPLVSSTAPAAYGSSAMAKVYIASLTVGWPVQNSVAKHKT